MVDLMKRGDACFWEKMTIGAEDCPQDESEVSRAIPKRSHYCLWSDGVPFSLFVVVVVHCDCRLYHHHYLPHLQTIVIEPTIDAMETAIHLVAKGETNSTTLCRPVRKLFGTKLVLPRFLLFRMTPLLTYSNIDSQSAIEAHHQSHHP